MRSWLRLLLRQRSGVGMRRSRAGTGKARERRLGGARRDGLGGGARWARARPVVARRGWRSGLPASTGSRSTRMLPRVAGSRGRSVFSVTSRRTRAWLEAEQLLVGLEAEPEAVQARVAVRLARGEAGAASALLVHRLDELGWTNLLAAPLLAQLVETRLAEDRLDDARAPAAALDVIAKGAGRDRVVAFAVAAHGRLALAEGREDAPQLLQEAVNRFAALGLRLDAARSRLELARSISASSPEVAVDTARHARTELEALGALRDADAAASLMRSLGAKGRAGPGRRRWGSSRGGRSRCCVCWAKRSRTSRLENGCSSARRPSSIT